ncbi:GtrA family protein [Paenibacillus sp. LMG 31460]|uniref:GtrA family protein n=1 Tax=Paenibacillus germinis TaxID=2654979 RepID=A0ABX1Z3W1_9BACL|nr:GtrA family protein [Paenibacillus germinis]
MFKIQAYRFIIVGLLSVLIDSSSYFILKAFVQPSLAKGISFCLGTILAYLLNKQWTFEEKEHQKVKIIKFVFLYLFSLSANVLVNKMSLLLFPEAYIFSFLAATGTSTVLNFIGQKWWVFRK